MGLCLCPWSLFVPGLFVCPWVLFIVDHREIILFSALPIFRDQSLYMFAQINIFWFLVEHNAIVSFERNVLCFQAKQKNVVTIIYRFI